MSKRAVWLAANSEHGDRLVEIAREHTRAAREYICLRSSLTPEMAQELRQKIEALRTERDAIIQQFEDQEVPAHA